MTSRRSRTCTARSRRIAIRSKCPETPMYLDAFLPDMPFTPGDIPMLGDHFMPTCTIAGFPATTLPGHSRRAQSPADRVPLGDAVHVPRQGRGEGAHREIPKAVVGQAQGPLDDDQGGSLQAGVRAHRQRRREQGRRRRRRASGARRRPGVLRLPHDDRSRSGTGPRARAPQDAGASRRSFRRAASRSKTRRSIRPTRGSGACRATSTPNVRRPIVNSLNLAHMMPVSSVWAGEETTATSNKCAASAAPTSTAARRATPPFACTSTSATSATRSSSDRPARANRRCSDCSPCSGCKYPDAQVIIFDKDRSARAATLAVGGACYEPGNERAQVGFQPLARIDEPAERVWAAQFIVTMLAAQGVEPRHDGQGRHRRNARQPRHRLTFASAR